MGILVSTDGAVPNEVGHDQDALRGAGFGGEPGQTIVLPQADGPPTVAIGVGPAGSLDLDGLRNAAGAFARAAESCVRLALVVPAVDGITAALAGQAATEGMLLARYRYDVLLTKPTAVALETVTLVGDDGLGDGVRRGQTLAGACALSRDLANCPLPTSPPRRWPISPCASERPAGSRSRCSTSPPSGSSAAVVCSA